MRYVGVGLAGTDTEPRPSYPEGNSTYSNRRARVILERIRPLRESWRHVLGPRAVSRAEAPPCRDRGLAWQGCVIVVPVGATRGRDCHVSCWWRLRAFPLALVASAESVRWIVERRLVLGGHQRIRPPRHLGLGMHLHILAADQESAVRSLEILRQPNDRLTSAALRV
jgi:hypothetical protein